MLKLKETKEFRKDLKRMRSRQVDMSKLDYVLGKLLNEEPLEPKYRDHNLQGDKSDFRECHITPDWILIYTINKGTLILTASRTGTHSDLFK